MGSHHVGVWRDHQPNMGNCFARPLLEHCAMGVRSNDVKSQNTALARISERFAAKFEWNRQIAKYQRLAGDVGLVSAVVQLLVQTPSVNQQDLALHALKWLCLDNQMICHLTFSQPKLIDWLDDIVTAAATEDFFMPEEHHRTASALRLLTTIARSLWDVHATLITTFLDNIATILQRSELPMIIRSQAVMFVCVVSCNPLHQTQIATHVNILVELIRSALKQLSFDDEGECEVVDDEDPLQALPPSSTVAAAIAISNTCSQKQYEAFLSAPETTKIIVRMMKAFERAIVGLDYPQGSKKFFRDWTLVASLAKFGDCERNKKLLCDSGMPLLLHKAVSQRTAHPSLVTHGLRLIKDLDQFSCDHMGPFALPALGNTQELFASAMVQIIRRNDEYARRKTMLFQQGTLFESKYKACMAIEDYIKRIEQFSCCSAECFLIAAVLIGRLETAYGRALLRTQTAHRLLLTAIMLGSKTHDDEFLNNKCFAQIGGIHLDELNQLEREFVKQLKHRLEVSRNEYEMCRQALQMIAMGGEIFSPRGSKVDRVDMTKLSQGSVIPWPGVICASPMATTKRPHHYLVGLLR
eukprot:c392_g1_i1.p1 GENE.c392_g1_i1~~c392_g1_i1.p1  ORF type:complete len:582 (-),score=117.87 c392_g1_i1:1-1746(-)